VALTLKLVCGLSSAEIAKVYSVGHTAKFGDRLSRPDLSRRGLDLARMVHLLLPDSGEATALLGLLLLTHARDAARVDDAGQLVLMRDQVRATGAGHVPLSCRHPRRPPTSYRSSAGSDRRLRGSGRLHRQRHRGRPREPATGRAAQPSRGPAMSGNIARALVNASQPLFALTANACGIAMSPGSSKCSIVRPVSRKALRKSASGTCRMPTRLRIPSSPHHGAGSCQPGVR
jgi:hypothetical protein